MLAVHRVLVAVVLLSLLALPVLGCSEAGVHVIDGDTLRLPYGETIRYIGIDTPERGEPYYEEATSANEQLVLSRDLRFETDVTNKDQYGRLLRYVFAENVFVNAELVRQGLALVYSAGKFPDQKYHETLREAAEEAANAGRGIWSMGLSHPKLLDNQEDYFIPASATG